MLRKIILCKFETHHTPLQNSCLYIYIDYKYSFCNMLIPATDAGKIYVDTLINYIIKLCLVLNEHKLHAITFLWGFMEYSKQWDF